jgi:hypothetical protein
MIKSKNIKLKQSQPIAMLASKKKNPCFQPGACLLNKNVKYKSKTVPTSYDACSPQKDTLQI